ncbi:major capsid protein [Acinetobacter johnsonii]|uniref:major capsid protein n=1 Tax=Acinetobacter johnsonii TaxID=40214 RepID=UPI001D0E5F13|nr:major capsid protein [Acinetobacter johnsonii]
MEKQNVIQLVLKPTLSTRLKQASVIAVGTALAAHASAASSIDATGLTGEIDGGKATIIALFGTALVILGIFAGWRYLKRGANSA